MGINVEYRLMRHVQRYAEDRYTGFKDYLSRFGIDVNVEFFQFRHIEICLASMLLYERR